MRVYGHRWRRATVSEVERARRNVTGPELLALVMILGVSVQELLDPHGPAGAWGRLALSISVDPRADDGWVGIEPEYLSALICLHKSGAEIEREARRLDQIQVIQKWHSGYRTKRAAEPALAEMVTSVHAGTFIELTSETVGEHLTGWLAAIAPTVRPATHYSYCRNLRLHVVPRLGSVQLRRIDGGLLNTVYARAAGEREALEWWRRTFSANGALYPHDLASCVQRRGPMGSAGPQPGRRRGSTPR